MTSVIGAPLLMMDHDDVDNLVAAKVTTIHSSGDTPVYVPTTTTTTTAATTSSSGSSNNNNTTQATTKSLSKKEANAKSFKDLENFFNEQNEIREAHQQQLKDQQKWNLVKSKKIPTLFLPRVKKIQPLLDRLNSIDGVANKYTIKCIQNGALRLHCKDMDTYTIISAELQKDNMELHTHQLRKNRDVQQTAEYGKSTCEPSDVFKNPLCNRMLHASWDGSNSASQMQQNFNGVFSNCQTIAVASNRQQRWHELYGELLGSLPIQLGPQNARSCGICAILANPWRVHKLPPVFCNSYKTDVATPARIDGGMPPSGNHNHNNKKSSLRRSATPDPASMRRSTNTANWQQQNDDDDNKSPTSYRMLEQTASQLAPPPTMAALCCFGPPIGLYPIARVSPWVTAGHDNGGGKGILNGRSNSSTNDRQHLNAVFAALGSIMMILGGSSKNPGRYWSIWRSLILERNPHLGQQRQQQQQQRRRGPFPCPSGGIFATPEKQQNQQQRQQRRQQQRRQRRHQQKQQQRHQRRQRQRHAGCKSLWPQQWQRGMAASRLRVAASSSSSNWTGVRAIQRRNQQRALLGSGSVPSTGRAALLPAAAAAPVAAA
ncbi:hypothetical protein ACLKA7_005572 [Drosophila subpalustris]